MSSFQLKGVGMVESDLLGDGRVRKILLQAGDGDCPKAGDKLEVHYSLTIADSEKVIDSSRDRGPPFAFTVGEDDVVRGLEEAILTMRPGEQASCCRHHLFMGL